MMHLKKAKNETLFVFRSTENMLEDTGLIARTGNMDFELLIMEIEKTPTIGIPENHNIMKETL